MSLRVTGARLTRPGTARIQYSRSGCASQQKRAAHVRDGSRLCENVARYDCTRNFDACGHVQSKKMQKFVLRSALRPNQISFLHGLGQNPNPPFWALCQLPPAADITPQMLTPLGATSGPEQVQQTASLFDGIGRLTILGRRVAKVEPWSGLLSIVMSPPSDTGVLPQRAAGSTKLTRTSASRSCCILQLHAANRRIPRKE